MVGEHSKEFGDGSPPTGSRTRGTALVRAFGTKSQKLKQLVTELM